MENYTDYNVEENYYQIPPKPSYPMENKVYETYNYDYNYDYNGMGMGLDMNSNLPRPATPTSPMVSSYNTSPRVSSPIPPRISSPIPQRISSPVPQRIASPVPQRIASPVPQRIASPVPQRIASPVPQRIASPVPQRIASPVPQRNASPVPQRNVSPTPRMGNPTTRDLPHSPLNFNFNYDDSEANTSYITNQYEEMKSLRSCSSLASLRPHKITEAKSLRSASSVTSLSSLRNQQIDAQLEQPLSPSTQRLINKKQPFDVIGSPQDQLQKLIFQGKAITSQLQSLSSQDTKLGIFLDIYFKYFISFLLFYYIYIPFILFYFILLYIYIFYFYLFFYFLII